jgi:hypothetical protein
MSFYENHECPVCKKKFEQNDDIVVCPECGTPHHRQCYDFIGHCVNQGLHQSGYDYYNENKPIVEQQDVQNSDTDEQHSTQNQTNQEVPFQNPFTVNPVMINSEYENDTQTINDESVADVAATVRTNVPRFIDKFKKMESQNSKFGWNWSAFFFGPFYLLFRKIYKQGILFLCAQFAAFFGCSYALTALAPKFTQSAMNIMQNAYDGSITQTELYTSLNKCFIDSSDGSTAKTIIMLIPILFLVINIIIATFADYFYKGTVSSIIKKVKSQLEQGASFMQSSVMMSSDVPLNQEQMKRIYLSRKGGVSLMPPLFAYLVINLLTYFI